MEQVEVEEDIKWCEDKGKHDAASRSFPSVKNEPVSVLYSRRAGGARAKMGKRKRTFFV